MKLCIPVLEKTGLQASTQPHFPLADQLLIFDTESRQHHYIDVNASENIPEEQMLIDAVLCASINRYTLRSLLDQGIGVYGTDAETAADAIAQFENGELETVAVAGRHEQGNCGTPDHTGEKSSAETRDCCGDGEPGKLHHECCGGHDHGDEYHECCGGSGHGRGGNGCCTENGEGRRHHAGRHGQCCGGHDRD